MKDFHIGQRVICVDDACCHPFPGVQKGKEYSVRWHGPQDFGVHSIPELAALARVGYGVKVKGITRGAIDWPFSAGRFKPLEPQAMQIFRQIAQNTPKDVFAQ